MPDTQPATERDELVSVLRPHLASIGEPPEQAHVLADVLLTGAAPPPTTTWGLVFDGVTPLREEKIGVCHLTLVGAQQRQVELDFPLLLAAEVCDSDEDVIVAITTYAEQLGTTG